MKRENFEEVKKLITQIENHESLLRDLNVVSTSSFGYHGRSVTVTLHSSQSFIPDKYDFLTIEYLEKVKDQVKAELKEMNERLLKM